MRNSRIAVRNTYHKQQARRRKDTILQIENEGPLLMIRYGPVSGAQHIARPDDAPSICQRTGLHAFE